MIFAVEGEGQAREIGQGGFVSFYRQGGGGAEGVAVG